MNEDHAKKLLVRSKQWLEALYDYEPSHGLDDLLIDIDNFLLKNVHELGCDEYHQHQASKCCRSTCWCKQGG